MVRSQDIVVSVVTRLWAGWSRVYFVAEERDSSLLENIQTISVAYPASSYMGTEGKVAGVYSWPLTSL